ncbi:MAG: tRNA (N(6)-L-threonylcarbamoyladenosine(37)-C(2))-methylthiotransferase MtaB [Erysipelotrichaceae bacterium]|nr:tRNA (N(6)-L-threonylcarbamoyladenosine(37)-C(2))-methylthiotransferase MtaB [Erysipelotrichaceae bacterium]
MANTFALYTLGCKVNQAESEGLRQLLKENGYKEVSFSQCADLYLVHTCAVTNTAAAKSRQKLHAAKKRNPKALVGAIGCYVQIAAKQLEKDADFCIGSYQKDQLLAVLNNLKNNRQSSPLITESPAFLQLPLYSGSGRTRRFLKVQDGCDQYCAYCVIPYARGHERSLDLKSCVKQAVLLEQQSIRELVLTGIHTGRYGKGTKKTLADLCAAILEACPKLLRLRISSIEITEVSDDLLRLFHQDSRLARHLHIPLQSGYDATLKRMRRPYTTAQYLERLQEIRKEAGDIAVSTDVIAGFPGESEAEFEGTMAFLEQCDFSFLHVFPYSPRDNTLAASMADQVSDAIKKQRVKKLLDLDHKLRFKHAEKMIAKSFEVLVESWKSNLAKGYNSFYQPVEFYSDNDLRNQGVFVTIQSVNETVLQGKKED